MMLALAPDTSCVARAGGGVSSGGLALESGTEVLLDGFVLSPKALLEKPPNPRSIGRISTAAMTKATRAPLRRAAAT